MPEQAADPLAIVKKRQMPTVVVLDMDLNIVWVNGEAESRVVVDLVNDSGETIVNPLRTGVVFLARRLVEASLSDPSVTHMVDVQPDGDNIYGLTADYLSPPGAQGANRMVMVHVEPVGLKREVDFDAVRRRWKVSRREQDVLRMLYYGKGNKEIAELLFISEYTVKDHIKAIMAKMDASSRAEIVYKLTTTA